MESEIDKYLSEERKNSGNNEPEDEQTNRDRRERSDNRSYRRREKSRFDERGRRDRSMENRDYGSKDYYQENRNSSRRSKQGDRSRDDDYDYHDDDYDRHGSNYDQDNYNDHLSDNYDSRDDEFEEFGDDLVRRTDRPRKSGRDGRSRRDDQRRGDSRRDDFGRRDEFSRKDRDRRSYNDFMDNHDDKWASKAPSNTVLIRGLPPHCEDTDISTELARFGAQTREVRLMKRKDTGACRGFAFVEFVSTDEAQHWMDHLKGELTVLGEYRTRLYYSTPRQSSSMQAAQESFKTDWTCSKCTAHNFRRRDFCFKCNISREESDRSKDGDGYDQLGSNPCNTLILRGLDALTTEENVTNAIINRLPSINIRNSRVIRDPLTSTSLGYCFVEFASIDESRQARDSLMCDGFTFEVDGKAILVEFARNTFSTVMATIAQSRNPAQTVQSGGRFYTQDRHTDSNAIQTDNTNAAAAVALHAIQQAQASKQRTDQVRNFIQNSLTGCYQAPYQIYPTPDVSTYTYDEQTGYYYDPMTTLYYDANSQYYYNSNTRQFLYWDAEKSSYLPAPNQEQQPTQPSAEAMATTSTVASPPTSSEITNLQTEDDSLKNKKVKDKKEKVKVAKKIAKDMEKWAKSQNAQKELQKNIMIQKSTLSLDQKKATASADAGFSVLEKKTPTDYSVIQSRLEMEPGSPSLKSNNQNNLVASYGSGGESDNDEGADEGGKQNSPQISDWEKKACLLCKRQFPTREALDRHNTMSDLHKKNLADLNSKTEEQQPAQQYRDRAKERREKYGMPDKPPGVSYSRRYYAQKAEAMTHEEPTKAGIGSDNIGNQLMQKMGWSLGQGLGSENQGIVEPIKAQSRTQQAGLGARGSSYDLPPSTDYRENAKRMMHARYNETS